MALFPEIQREDTLGPASRDVNQAQVIAATTNALPSCWDKGQQGRKIAVHLWSFNILYSHPSSIF